MNDSSSYHIPVMGNEVVQWLVTDPYGLFADFTVGGGGHSKLILNQLRDTGRLCGIDRDPEAIAEARRTLPDRNELWNIRFSEAESKLFSRFGATFSGVLLDLGVSSHQLDDEARGFSYRSDGPLDLRMSQETGETAAQLLARLSELELKEIFKTLGEDPQAGRIARAVVKARNEAAIETTGQLTDVIRKSVSATAQKSLPRVFQALRMVVNCELEELSSGLNAAWKLLKPTGRLVVLTYHSLEDRPVKQFMQALVQPPQTFSPLPTAPSPRPQGKYPIRGPLLPTPQEIAENPRSRSAKFRVIEKLA